jgi:hypothetical protein
MRRLLASGIARQRSKVYLIVQLQELLMVYQQHLASMSCLKYHQASQSGSIEIG